MEREGFGGGAVAVRSGKASVTEDRLSTAEHLLGAPFSFSLPLFTCIHTHS